MTKEEVNNLQHGLYIIKWKKKEGGGSSLASIGSASNGDRWLAPCNWISYGTTNMDTWHKVKKVKIVKIINYENNKN